MLHKPLPFALLVFFATFIHAYTAAETQEQKRVLSFKEVVLIGLGDSLTHGTMDATNNSLNSLNAYLQKVYESLSGVATVSFTQPLLDNAEKRLLPFSIPTNLGVDGSDVFSLEGLEYYRRVGEDTSKAARYYTCEKLLPCRLDDLYDNVLYPINLFLHRPATQLESTIWLLNQVGLSSDNTTAACILWIGNNDSSNAALGYGARNPTFMPLPFELLQSRLKPGLAALIRLGLQHAALSLEPYSMASIQRNLTVAEDFAAQYENIISRMENEVPGIAGFTRLFLCTLPYYSSVGYLFDSEDLEYYLQKVDPGYSVPASFSRVTGPGEPVGDYTRGDRIGLITFMCMYSMLSTGFSIEQVNQVLEENGTQRDGLVLSEAEQSYIQARIDSFNEIIIEAAVGRESFVQVIDTGGYLNDILTGKTPLTIGKRGFNRKWVRGGSFTIDGVHPGYTGQALIANYIIGHVNDTLGLNAPLHDLETVARDDPYVDNDGDGWALGPPYSIPGFTEILYLLKDPDDGDPAVVPTLPTDIWLYISDVLLREFFL